MTLRKSPSVPLDRGKLIVVPLAALCLCAILGGMVLAYPLFYRDRIYPGVIVQGIDLGGMTVDEATARLADTLSDPSQEGLVLVGGGRAWNVRGEDVGRQCDVAQTVRTAYQAGRRGPWYQRPTAAWRIRFQGIRVEPHTQPAEPERVRAIVETIAPQVRAAPSDAEIQIGPSGVTCVDSESGQTLDVEATVQRAMDAFAKGSSEVELVTVPLLPRIADVEPACEEAKHLLSQPFTVVIDDPLTDHYAEFAAATERMTSWLQAVPNAPGFALRIRDGQVEAWLLELAQQVGPERTLETEETLTRVLAALRAGEHRAQCAVRHPESSHVVQPGDNLFDIAYSYGFPLWRLEEANPDVQPAELAVGMELTIPSIDILFPHPLAPGKRIEIDLPQQRLQAYEDDYPVYDFTCSSGMTSTPTIAGQFQVLYKEPQAYAQRWYLEMPYFMAIYYEGPDFANGIHELPIRADGHRLWASVLGWPASYGCVILDVGDAEKLYHWAPVGTLVQIKGLAPGTPVYVPTYDDENPDS